MQDFVHQPYVWKRICRLLRLTGKILAGCGKSVRPYSFDIAGVGFASAFFSLLFGGDRV